MRIRPEQPGDEDAIHELTLAAFEPMPFSDGTEAPIVRSLRGDGDLTISLVAEEDGVIIGHVAFSPVSIDGASDGWFGLGPVSVAPDRQRRGIGSALIGIGLQQLRDEGALGCALIGNPAVYRGMGFESDGLLTYRSLDVAFVQRIVFRGPAPRGRLRFAAAFESAGDETN
ncbi:GNAT family N-acetyltransferase [Agromyces sp. NPDC057865]|uniref:GNAT family N-acetyltransferase n=1 Tax=Agromyces sp. NPDC057865 TaxID=3346267 RepID=UPI00366F2585